MSYLERVVVLVDMDCFYCQVEEKLNPSLKGKPIAVVQYNAWKGGGIIAVNYPARDRGVTRHMRGDEAKQKCPEIELVRVPTVRGKADLTKFRDAGKEVAKVLQRFTPLLERASVDEAYLDITEVVNRTLQNRTKEITLGEIRNTHVAASDTMDFLYNLYSSGLYVENNLKLAVAAALVEEIRAAVFEETGYTCSAGIAHNKILAKLSCGLNKPNKQTILPQDNIQELYKDLPVRKIRSLGGKFGNALSEDLGITKMAELAKFSEKELAKRYDEKTASFLYNIARGINNDPVTTRLIAKSIGCCKKFAGKAVLVRVDSVKHWLNELSAEISERLENDYEENNRKAKQIVICFTQETNGKVVTSSRTHPLNSYEASKIASEAYEVVKKHCMKPTGTFCIKYLGLNVGKFEDRKSVNEITSFFKVGENVTILNEKSDKNTNNIESDLAHQEGHNDQVSDTELELQQTFTQLLHKNNNLKQDDDSISNNFSDSTVETDEKSSEFKFFNENGNTSDSDSISNELTGSNNKEKNETAEENKNPEKGSFFLRYFENLKRESKSPVARDFNTSRNLEVDEASDSNDEESDSINNIPENIHDIPGTSKDSFNNFQQIIEACSECQKKLPKSEMISHMDYHFALKIVREESQLYKQQLSTSSSPTKKQTKNEVKKNGKRKFVEVENNPSIKEFFKIEAEESEGLDENTQLCPQCNKRINITSFSSHLDYHAAKKLHMEINVVKSCATESIKKNKIKKTEKTKDAKHARDSVPSVTMFFKPVN